MAVLFGGVICLVYSENERDLSLLNSCIISSEMMINFLEGLLTFSQRKLEAITGLRCPLMFWAARALH